MSTHAYLVYGLQLHSTFPLPELVPVAPSTADVTINLGDVPASIGDVAPEGVLWQRDGDRRLLVVEGVARYLVSGDRHIQIAPDAGEVGPDVRAFLLGSVIARILHARYPLVLHASVVGTAGGAVAFLGHSGAGKSSLLAALTQRGYTMVADDKAVVSLDSTGTPVVHAGFPRLRLTPDAVSALAYPTGDATVLHALDKYVVASQDFTPSATPLARAYILEWGTSAPVHLDRLKALEAFDALNRYTYRRRFMDAPSQRGRHFAALSAVSQRTRVTRVRRPTAPFAIHDLAARIHEDLSA